MHLHAWFPGSAVGAVGFGVAIAAALILLRLAIIAAFGAIADVSAQDHRIAVVVSLLTGFTAASILYGNVAARRDLESWRHELGWSAAEMARFREREAPRRGPLLLWAFAFAAVSPMLLTARNDSTPFLLTDAPWTLNIVWSLAANLLLFAVIGCVAYLTNRSIRQTRALEARPTRIDLLDLSSARQRATSGLRLAFFWLGGSSLAAPLFVDLNFSWLTIAVVSLSFVMGVWLFLSPLLRLAKRIRSEKEAELGLVRERIRTSRDALLIGAPPTAQATELPTLLAWEQRIDGISEWAVDVSSLLRFGTLIVLALGSWLGGALTDRALDSVLK